MISFYPLSTASDLLVGVESTASSQPSLFSSFNRQQPFKLVNLPQTKSMFSHVGWTAGMEWKSYSRDTGPTRSKRQRGVNRWVHRPRNATVPSNCVSPVHRYLRIYSQS